MKLESEKAGVILGFIGVSWVSRGTLSYPLDFCMFSEASFRNSMFLYNFTDFWKGFVLLVNAVPFLVRTSFRESIIDPNYPTPC